MSKVLPLTAPRVALIVLVPWLTAWARPVAPIVATAGGSRGQGDRRRQVNGRGVRDLWGMGVPDAQAEAWIVRWKAEAEALGLTSGDPAYWRLAAAWIDEAREAD